MRKENKAIQEPVKKSRTIPSVVLIILIAVMGTIVYFNTFGSGFVWDDEALILGNEHIKSFSSLKNIFKEDLFFMDVSPTGYYRPIQTLSYMMDYLLWAKDPFGYHLTNLILQILSAILVFYLCMLVTGEKLRSFFIASIFCIHPAFTALVSYISGRADLLGLLFSLVAIYLAVRYALDPKPKGTLSLWVAALSYILAILSKEYYMITPLLIWLYVSLFKEKVLDKKRIKALLFSMLLIFAAYSILRATVLNLHQAMGGMAEQPFLSRLAVFPYIITNYVFAVVVPVNLGMVTKLVYSSLAEPRFLFSYLTPLLIAFALYHFHKKKQELLVFSLGWFAIAIFTVSNLLIPLKAFSAEHWVYMASIGFIIFFVMAIKGLGERFRNKLLFRNIQFVFAAGFIIFFGATTIESNKHWKDDEALFSWILKKNPDHSKALFNLGNVYRLKGDYQKAVELYKKAINASPTVGMYHNNLGMLYAELGMMDKAREEMNEAIRLFPNAPEFRKNLSLIEEGSNLSP